MYKVFPFLFFLILYLPLAQVPDKNNTPAKREPIKLIRADSCMNNEKDGIKLKECQGNVVIVQGNVTVTSEKVIQYIDENRADFSGNVVVKQEDMTLESPKISYYGSTGIAISNSGITVRDKKGRLKADRGTYSTQTQIADFMGNVKVSDDTVNIYTDIVQYHRNTRISYAYGNVKIEEDSVLIFCDTAEHHRNSRISYAYGNVKIIDDSVYIFADRIEHDRNARLSKALGNVLVKARFSDIFLFADTIENNTYISQTVATGSPMLFQVDTIKSRVDTLYLVDTAGIKRHDIVRKPERYDTLSVVSDSIIVYRGFQERYVFIDSVQMIKGETSAKCGLAVYYKAGELIELKKLPVVWYDSTQLHGDSIIVKIPGRKLEEIHSYNNSFAASKEDTLQNERINQILGKEIIIKIEDDTIRNIFSYGDSKSLYYIFTDGAADGAKRDGADSIVINFRGGEIENIIWLGGIEGEFLPENIIYTNPASYYLPAFRWDSDRPRKKYLNDKRRKYEKLNLEGVTK